jgi:hypothetical protein
VALRPVTPVLPFTVPNSFRLMDVTMPIGATANFSGIDPTNAPRPVANSVFNFGWEYVWHCHILGHEENDMMRAIIAAVPPEAPTLTAFGTPNPLRVTLTWVNKSLSTTSWAVQKKLSSGSTWTTIASGLPASTLTYQDTSVTQMVSYDYRVVASNTVGTLLTNFPSTTVTSTSAVATVLIPVQPNPPTNVTAVQLNPSRTVLVSWVAPVGGAPVTGFNIYRRISPSTSFTLIGTIPLSQLSYLDTSSKAAGVTYTYGVNAYNAAGTSTRPQSTPIVIV